MMSNSKNAAFHRVASSAFIFVCVCVALGHFPDRETVRVGIVWGNSVFTSVLSSAQHPLVMVSVMVCVVPQHFRAGHCI